MGFRFRKSFKIAPGVRVNFGKKSSSISFGRKGARHTISSTGRRTTTIGIPGTGLSYTSTSKKKKKSAKPKTATKNTQKRNSVKYHSNYSSDVGKNVKANPMIVRICVSVVAAVMFIHGTINITSSGWILMLIAAALFFAIFKSAKKEKSSIQPQEDTNTETVQTEDADGESK